MNFLRCQDGQIAELSAYSFTDARGRVAVSLQRELQNCNRCLRDDRA